MPFKRTRKVRIAILDSDNRATTFKKCPITEDGQAIKVKIGGKAHLSVRMNNDCLLELPRPKYVLGGWNRFYVAKKGASECINFRTPFVPTFDPDAIMDAAATTLTKGLGKEPKKDTPVIQYCIFILLIIIAAMIVGVIPV